MRNRVLLFLAFGCTMLLNHHTVIAQNTFDEVFTILQTNCAITNCHGGTNALAYDLGTTPSETYNAIVGATPLNAAANAKGFKLVDPGHPYNSFLMKKIGGLYDNYLALEPAEGNPMPKDAPSLDDYEIELVRQWILTGAKQSGVHVDTALVRNFTNGNHLPYMTPPPAPPAGQGFQVRLGPILLDREGSSSEEIEYLKKEHLPLSQDAEVVRLEGFMNDESHHFLLFKFDDVAGADAEGDGLRLVNLLNTATDGAKELQSAWQDNDTFNLPPQAAFYWNQTDWLDLNYHIRNSSPTSILPADFYLNVYTQPRGSGRVEMRAELVNNPNFYLAPNSTHSETMTHTWSGDDRQLWSISSHTHKYGTRFDIFERQPNGSKGEMIYNGNYDPTYTFDQGFYDWAHPTVRVIDTLHFLSQAGGLIAETEWNNTSNDFITFGLTTADEMQLMTLLYFNANDTAVVARTAPHEFLSGVVVYPNPAREASSVSYVLEKGSAVSGQVLDIWGREVLRIPARKEIPGAHSMRIDLSGLQSQVYFLRLNAGDQTVVRKIIVQN